LISAFFVFDYLYKDVSKAIIEGILSGLRNGSITTGEDIVSSAEVIKAKSFLIYTLLGVFLTLIFSYIIAKVTLVPARNSLNSQKRFISDISHELRTPISTIKTNCEVAMMDEDSNSKMYKIMNSNIEELDRISQIINNILSFNKLVRPDIKRN